MNARIKSTTLPQQIPAGARIVVRTYIIIEDNNDGTQKIEYHDAIGHVLEWDGIILHLLRDPAANGTRAAEEMFIDANTIYRLKPIPERKFQKPLKIQTLKLEPHQAQTRIRRCLENYLSAIVVAKIRWY